MKTSPIQQVQAAFGKKAKLVSAVQSLATDALWLDRVNPDKGLGRISNTKLLRLHGHLSRAKEQFGSRDALIGAILTLSQRSKDDGYKAHLAGYPVPRLLDLHDSLSKKPSTPVTPAPKAEGQRKARTKKAKLKAA